MKILMSALACEPGKGSELEVGFRAMLAAARRHDVWVLTNKATIPIVRRAIEGEPAAERIHLEGIYFEVDDELYPRLTPPGFHWYYDRWQRRAAIRAAELDHLIDFDVVHHVTLAAHWTRAGVAVVDKPLVWGPVGGGVDAPLSLFSDLGWRGVLEEVGRFCARRLLARIGPARVARQRAVVVFAQNEDTARVISSAGRLQVLPNATSVDLRELVPSGPRGNEILLVSRLLPWKGGRLAVRALRHLQHSDAVLRIFGEGPDRHRIARAARQWGVADRVRFEGHLRRDELLRLVGRAGVFLHPAFHDEAGLAVAEALSLGTPVVCLDRGGPSELLRHWPDAPATVVRVQSPESTARALASAIDQFLFHAPPVQAIPQRAVTSFEDELLGAYDVAFQAGRDRVRVWGFPAGKPQVFADTLTALSKALPVYSFGRRLPRWLHRSVALQVRIPIVRRLIVEPQSNAEPVCGWSTWHAVLEELRRRSGGTSMQWIQFSSQWGKQRSSVLGLDRDGFPQLFAVIEPAQQDLRQFVEPVASFRVPACTDSFHYENWLVRQYEPLPRFHRPATWEVQRMRRVAEDASRILEDVLERPQDIPRHWRPMHGDFVPWNLREDRRGQLWLLDWEDAGWGPPLADLVRYLIAAHSLRRSSPAKVAAAVRKALVPDAAEGVVEAASFWLEHPNLQPVRRSRALRRRKAKDVARVDREFAALSVLASQETGVRSLRGTPPLREPVRTDTMPR